VAQDIVSVFAIGRLTRDSELKYTGGGLAIAKFSIACNSRAKKGDEWIDEASFLEVSVFGKSAESLNQYLLKGKQIAVQGRLKQERWESDGQTRSKIVINADNVQLLGGDKNTQGSAPDARNSPSRASQGYSGAQPDFDSDIPF
jgi:single-strand DNA-binding protein